MTAIREILYMSVICHFAIYILCILSDNLLHDHIASGVESFAMSFTSHITQFLLQPFTKWDSVYYLQIATTGYTNEKQLVFFPLYPALMKYVSILFVQMSTLNQMECTIISGLLISAMCRILSPVVLYNILLRLDIDDRTSRNSALCFVYNPAGIFFTTVYTESLFACLSWLGFLMFLSKDLGQSLLASVPLLLASCTRSNGNLNSVVVMVVSAIRVGQLICEGNSIKGVGRRKKESRSARAIRGDVVCEAIKAVAVSICCWTPYIVFSLVGRMVMCDIPSGKAMSWLRRLLYSAVVADTDTLSEYCSDTATSLSPYAYLQSKYWNVGFLRFYQWRQTPNFLLAVPITVLAFFVINCAADTVWKSWRSIMRPNKRHVIGRSPHQKEPVSWMEAFLADRLPAVLDLCKQIHLPFLLHLVCLLVLALLYAHVQITTRLLCSTSPLIYIALARLLGSRSRQVRRAVACYLLLYNIVGAVLHVNNYPWT